MLTLRRLHLYLGCFFAPMLLFFVVSGLWQMYRPVSSSDSWSAIRLSTLHTGRSLKSDVLPTLSSPALRGFILLMALSLLLNVGLGLTLAFRSSHRRAALWSVFTGAVLPAAMVAFVIWQAARSLAAD